MVIFFKDSLTMLISTIPFFNSNLSIFESPKVFSGKVVRAC